MSGGAPVRKAALDAGGRRTGTQSTPAQAAPPRTAPAGAAAVGAAAVGAAAVAVDPIAVRDVRRADLDRVIAIDTAATGLEKRRYWLSVYRRYAADGRAGRHFLVAVAQGRVRGFIVGEVRDWEFGSPPCGWVFGIDVEPGARLGGIGTRLLDAICARFRRDGVSKVRTMLARDNTLILSFFRSQGMMAGPFIPLEKSLGE